MIQRLLFFTFLILSCLIIRAAGKSRDTLATVGKYSILLSDFKPRYDNYIFSAGIKDNIPAREAILNNMINEILLAKYDNNENVYNDPEYKLELKWTRNNSILGYLKDQEIYAKITVSDKECRQAFTRVNDKIAARHLFAKTEKEANNLYELLKAGADFNLLAKQVFSDTALAKNGGYLGYFTWGDMDPAFEDAAYALKVGEISKPVKTEYGYSIIKVEDRETDPLLTEQQYLLKKSRLEYVLRIRKKTPAERNYIEKVFNFNKLKFNQKALENILPSYTNIIQDNLEPDRKNKSYSNCVEYKGKVYSQKEIENRLNNTPVFEKEKIISIGSLKSLISGLFVQEELLKIAHQKGYDTNPDMEDMYSKMGSNLFFKFKMKEIAGKYNVPDSSALNFYKDNIIDFSAERELNLKEIILDGKSNADSIHKLLLDGASFEDIARKVSMRKWTAEKGGEMGFVPVSKLGMLKDTLWNSPEGAVIGPINIEGHFGIFKVIGKIDSKPVEFQKIKNEVIEKYKTNHSVEIVKRYLDKIQRGILIKKNDDLLASINSAG